MPRESPKTEVLHPTPQQNGNADDGSSPSTKPVQPSSKPEKDWRKTIQNSNVVTKWKYLLVKEKFTDFTFFVGENREPVYCHRLVMKMQSKHFEDVLADDVDSIDVTSCSVPVFRNIIKYLYTDQLDLTAADAMDAVILAENFQLNTLRNKSAKIVTEGLSVENAAEIMRKADLIDDKELGLGLKAQEFVLQNAEQVMFTEGFKEISSHALQKLLQLDHKLWNATEVRILEGVKAWASAKCHRQGKGVTGPELYSVSKTSLAYIDFKKLSLADFNAHVVKSKLLPADDMLEIQSDLIEKKKL